MDPTPPTGGRRGKQLRTAVEAARRGRPTPADRNGDEDLLTLLANPYTSVEETCDRLAELRTAFEERDDRRCAFLSVYTHMTRAVAERIDREDFEDPEWVDEYLVAFANLYRKAVRQYETGNHEPLPDAWHLAFEAAEKGDSLVLQDAALGVNAHINYDLALALETVGIDPHRSRKYEDHKAVTDVIRTVVDDAQAILAERDAPGIAELDESLGSIDDRLLVHTIDECRDSAWRTAVALHSRFGLRRRFARWINDVTSVGAARLILSSKTSGGLHDRLLDLESGGSVR